MYPSCPGDQRALVLLERAIDRQAFCAHPRVSPLLPRTRVAPDVESADRYLDDRVGVLVVPGARLLQLQNLPRVCEGWPAPVLIVLEAAQGERENASQLVPIAPIVLAFPIDFDELARTLETILLCLLPLETALRRAVGQRGLRDIRHLVTWVLLREALHQSRYNRHQTARLLGVSRSAVQQMMARFEVPLPGAGVGVVE